MSYFHGIKGFLLFQSKFIFRRSDAYFYLLTNIYVALAGFLRSILFIYFFSFQELGNITILMTASGFTALLQLGVINGGYRIIAGNGKTIIEKVNNIVFTYFLFIASLLIIFQFIAVSQDLYQYNKFSIFFLILSITGLISNWLSNRFIGESSFKKISIANIISSSISIIVIPLSKYFGITVAYLSITIQPLLFIIALSYRNSQVLPKKFEIDIKYFKYILNYGFIPYLSGAFFILYQQVERWSINSFLGTEYLGRMYLVFLTINICSLVPTSINNFYFPKAVKTFADNDYGTFHTTIKSYFKITLIYSLFISVAILLLFKPIIGMFLAKYIPYINLVFLTIPALFFKNLCDPFTLYLNSIRFLKPIFWSDLISTIIYIISIISIWMLGEISLESVVILFSIYNCIKLLVLYTAYRQSKKNIM